MSAEPTRVPTRIHFLYVAYALSGFIGLGYQVYWFRVFVERFGANNLTFTLVILNFIGGLGIGSWFSREIAATCSKLFRWSDPLRIYGALELALALLLLLTPLLRVIPANLFGPFPYDLHDGIYYPAWSVQFFKSVIACAVVFLPCVIMGTTFPLLCRAFPHAPRFPSSLYAWNTLGACASVLICEFFLLPRFGQFSAFVLVWIVNLALAVCFLLPGICGASSTSNIHPVYDAHTELEAPSTGDRIRDETLIGCAALGGLAAGTLEAGMHQIVSFAGYPFAVAMSFVSFWAILAIFLASWTVHTFKRTNFSLLKAGYAIAAILYLVIRHRFGSISEFCRSFYEAYLIEAGMNKVQLSAAYAEWLGMGSLWMFVGIVVFPVCYLVSLLLPYVCNAAQSKGRGVEKLYAINTFAFCAGMLLFSRVAPRVSIFYSIKLHAAIFAVIAVLVILLNRDRKPQIWKLTAAAIAALVLIFLTGRGFDRRFFRPDDPLQWARISSLKSNGTHTTYVTEHSDSKSLYFDSHSMSATSKGDQIYMRLMAHFPLLAHPRPESALLICFGVGNTASAIAAHSTLQKLDIVDLNDRVFQTAHEFAATNFKVYEDPRVALITDDGRRFLEVTDRKYDLITSEPPPPVHEGIFRLYSLEYYRSALEHLTPDGIMTQWLPLNQVSAPATDLMVSAFNQAFPNTLLFIGRYNHLILVGSRSPLDLARMKQRFSEDPKVVEELVVRCLTPTYESLVARIVQSDRMLDARYGNRPPLHDGGADLSHYAFNIYTPFFNYDPARIADDLFPTDADAREKFRQLTSNLETLKQTVPDFPDTNIHYP